AFGGAAGCVVLGIEVQHGLAAPQGFEADLPIASRLSLKGWDGLVEFEGHARLSRCFMGSGGARVLSARGGSARRLNRETERVGLKGGDVLVEFGGHARLSRCFMRSGGARVLSARRGTARRRNRETDRAAN